MTRSDLAPDTSASPDPAGSTKSPGPRRLPRGIPFFAIIAVAVIALMAGGAGGAYQGKLSEVQKNDNSSFLPASAESTESAAEAAKFNAAQSIPGFLVFHRDAGLTADDKKAIAAVFSAVVTLKC